jgi:TPP-dependent 2-oxoacid decarboxylase
VVCLSGCSWFGWRKHELPNPAEIIVNGAPMGSIVFVDGVQTGQSTAVDDRSQIINVAVGDHKVEIHSGDKIVYREDTYVGPGEHRVVTVLSGLSR